MPTLDYLHGLFHYNYWANQESLDSVSAVEQQPKRAIEVLAHIAGAELLWLERLLEIPQTAVVWPDLSLLEVNTAFDDLNQRWMSYLSALDANALCESVDYVNSLGEPWRNTRQDMLMHVVVHSSYHRGQVAIVLGLVGHKSAYTDLIHGVRQQLF